jgi:hypothetical protein
MDLDTLLTTLYVVIDDWYKGEGATLMKREAGATPQMSDSEVLTVAIAGQFRSGVPWQSERAVVRWMQKHGQGWFPRMLGRSAFNERTRQLWGALLRLQQMLADWLSDEQMGYEVVDVLPLRACRLAQANAPSHWLWWSRLGRGGNQSRWFFGEQWLVACLPNGAITGWLLGPANVDDRWLLQALLSARQGHLCLEAPAPTAQPPASGDILPRIAANPDHRNPLPYLADQGFNGPRWFGLFRRSDATVLATPPPHAAPDWPTPRRRFLNARRQLIESVFAALHSTFDLDHLRAHSRWGQLTRLAAIGAAFNFALWLNRCLGHSLLAVRTLIC